MATRATAKHVHIILKMLGKMLENLLKSLTRESTAKTCFDLRLAMIKSQCALGFTRNVKKIMVDSFFNEREVCYRLYVLTFFHSKDETVKEQERR